METTLSLVPCLNDCGPYGQCLLLRRHGYLYAGCSCKAGEGQAWMPLNTPALGFPAVCLLGAHPSSAKAGEHPHRARANASSPLLPHTPISYASTERQLQRWYCLLILTSPAHTYPHISHTCPTPAHICTTPAYPISHTCLYLYHLCPFLSHLLHLPAPAYPSHTCLYLLIPVPYCPTPAPHLPTPVPHMPHTCPYLSHTILVTSLPHLPHPSPIPASYLPDSCLPLLTLALPTHTCPTPVSACSWVRRGLLWRALLAG